MAFLKARDPVCKFGVLLLSCETEAAPKPPDLGGRGKKGEIFGLSAWAVRVGVGLGRVALGRVGPKGGRPKISRFFPSLPSIFVIFLSFSGVFSWNFGGV